MLHKTQMLCYIPLSPSGSNYSWFYGAKIAYHYAKRIHRKNYNEEILKQNEVSALRNKDL